MLPRATIPALVFLGILLAGCTTPATDDGAGDGDAGGEDPAMDATNQTVPPIVWGALEGATIRPGASLGGYCTFNWLYTAANGSAFIGTAGHCTNEIGERVRLGESGSEIGTVVYDSDNVTGAERRVDFSLIRIDTTKVAEAHPQMLNQEGPTGTIGTGEAATGDLLSIYGHGIVLGDEEPTRARSGLLVDEDGQTYRADIPAVYGDSGSPLLHVETGKAFGIISQFGYYEIPPSTDTGPVMPFILTELGKAGWNVTVATV